MGLALRPVFDVRTKQGEVLARGVVGDDPVDVAPGRYTVHVKGDRMPGRPVTALSDNTARVQL